MSVGVSRLVVGDTFYPGALSRDDRRGFGAADHAAQSVGVVAFVGDDVPGTDSALEQRWSRVHVDDVTW